MTKDNLGQLYADMFGPNQGLWSGGIVKPPYLPQVGQSAFKIQGTPEQVREYLWAMDDEHREPNRYMSLAITRETAGLWRRDVKEKPYVPYYHGMNKSVGHDSYEAAVRKETARIEEEAEIAMLATMTDAEIDKWLMENSEEDEEDWD